jgi:hypothetical protein
VAYRIWLPERFSAVHMCFMYHNWGDVLMNRLEKWLKKLMLGLNQISLLWNILWGFLMWKKEKLEGNP